MAKIIFSGGVSAASGSVGGNVFSRNANGAYMRNKGIPTNPNTIAQQNARAALAAQSQIWRSLTDVQKQSFRDQVTAYPYIDSLGQSKTYTPSQLCGAVNGRVKQANRYAVISGDGIPAPIISTMSAPFGFPFVEDAAMTFDVSSSIFTSVIGLSDAAASLPDGTILLIDATAPLSSGKTSPKNSDYRNWCALGSNEPVNSVTPNDSTYLDIFGVLPSEGNLIYVRFTTLNTDIGQYSNSIATVLQIVA